MYDDLHVEWLGDNFKNLRYNGIIERYVEANFQSIDLPIPHSSFTEISSQAPATLDFDLKLQCQQILDLNF